MFKNIMATALVAGIAVGLILTVLQLTMATPLILQAEIYETGEAASVANTEAPAGKDAGGSVSENLTRNLLTGLATVLTAIGFGLVLIALMVLNGRPIDWKSGLLWGLGGFTAVTLSPSLGLAPGLPGSASAVLGTVQIWWLGTVLATAIGLWLIFFKEQPVFKSAGLVLIILPHLVGAPMPDQLTSNAPAELAGSFASVSIVLSAVFWALLGVTTGLVWHRLVQRRSPVQATPA